MREVSKKELENWQHIQRHEVHSCTKCQTPIYGWDVRMPMILRDGKVMPVRCPNCGHLDKAMEVRTYGLSEKEIRERGFRAESQKRSFHEMASDAIEQAERNKSRG